MDRSLNWRWLAPIAACLVLALAIAGPLLNRGGGDLELKRSSGVKVSYVDNLPAKTSLASLADLMWLTEDELFATHVLGYEIAVFEGTVKEVRNIACDFGSRTDYRAIAAIEVGEVLRGSIGVGDTVNLLLPAPVGTDIWVEDTGVSTRISKGTRGIFLPIKYDETSIYEEGGQKLALLDLAGYGLPDGERWLFLETAEGLVYLEDAYPSFAGAKDLQDIKKIILAMIDKQ